MVSLTTTFRTCAEAGEETARRAKANMKRDSVATIFLRAPDKSFDLCELPRADTAAGRQNIEIKELAGKILRNKELHG